MPLSLHFPKMVVLSVVIMAAMILFEHKILGTTYIPEVAPRLVAYDVLRSVVALALSLGLVRSLWRDGMRWGEAFVPRLPAPAFWVAGIVLMSAASAAWLFFRSPALFNTLSLEDSAVEWFSAFFLFAAAAGFAVIALGQLAQLRQGAGRLSAFAAGLAALFSLMFFVIGMEEISWMQRVFHVATPEVLMDMNDQHEFNFHNMATGVSELVYYSGAFVLLVLMPFGFAFFRKPLGRWPQLAAFAPSLTLLVASAPMAAFNSGRWGVLPIQMSMMMTVIILFVLANSALVHGLWREFLLFALLALGIVAIQELFLVNSANLVRLWDPTEYKELFIAFGIALYTFEIWQRLRVRKPVVIAGAVPA